MRGLIGRGLAPGDRIAVLLSLLGGERVIKLPKGDIAVLLK
jgi:hypothetical protein